MKIICLVSGGIDSTVLLFRLHKEGHDIIPLHINYGQKSAKLELESVYNACDLLQLKPQIVDLSGLKIIRSGLTDPELSHITDPVFPGRNLLFLTIAASFANSNAIDVVAMGILGGSLFPDQSKEFVKKAELTISSALGAKMKILTPFIKLNKLEVVRIGKMYDFPLNSTYSCYAGTELPCGKCLSCIDRENTLQ